MTRKTLAGMSQAVNFCHWELMIDSAIISSSLPPVPQRHPTTFETTLHPPTAVHIRAYSSPVKAKMKRGMKGTPKEHLLGPD